MDYANPALMRLRALARRAGIIPFLSQVVGRLGRRDYEALFGDALEAEIRPGDTVWDIGANVGFYSVRFARIVGQRGRVVAFEPSPQNIPQLERAASDHPNIRIEAVALSNFEGSAMFALREGTTDGLTEGEGVPVAVKKGDDCAENVGVPDVVKIDVEGYELEVLQGMQSVLSGQRLRAVFVEVHFSQLAGRGQPETPARLKALLQSNGFVLRWIDPSHLLAARG